MENPDGDHQQHVPKPEDPVVPAESQESVPIALDEEPAPAEEQIQNTVEPVDAVPPHCESGVQPGTDAKPAELVVEQVAETAELAVAEESQDTVEPVHHQPENVQSAEDLNTDGELEKIEETPEPEHTKEDPTAAQKEPAQKEDDQQKPEALAAERSPSKKSPLKNRQVLSIRLIKADQNERLPETPTPPEMADTRTRTSKAPERRPRVLQIPPRSVQLFRDLTDFTTDVHTTRTRLRFTHGCIGLVALLGALLVVQLQDTLHNIGHPTESPVFAILLMTELVRLALNERLLLVRAAVKYVTLPGYNENKGRPIPIKARTFVLYSVLLAGVGYACLFASCILFGAPLLGAHAETATLAAVLLVVVLVPMYLYVGPLGTLQYMFCANFQLSDRTQVAYMAMLKQNALFALFGAWGSSAAIILDWDRAWQRYPIPNVCGALLGLALSNVLLLLDTLVRVCRRRLMAAEPLVRKNRADGAAAAARRDAATNTQNGAGAKKD